jgi:hypothetical protein
LSISSFVNWLILRFGLDHEIWVKEVAAVSGFELLQLFQNYVSHVAFQIWNGGMADRSQAIDAAWRHRGSRTPAWDPTGWATMFS